MIVNEGIKSIVNNELCVIIMMGEHGEQSIQSNLESYNHLDNILNEYEKRKSNVFGQDLSRVTEQEEEDIKESKENSKIKEIKVKEIFVNKVTLKEKNQKEQFFLNTGGGNAIRYDILNKEPNLNNYEDNEVLFEKALKAEKKKQEKTIKTIGSVHKKNSKIMQ